MTRAWSPGALLLAFSLLVAGLGGGCSDGEGGGGPEGGRGAHGPARARNLLLVTFDTTRADHLGAYGDEGAETPVIDRLAAEGVLFEHCASVTPVTLPSHTSLLTGLYPYEHGVRDNGTHWVPADVETLAETLSAAGFRTGAVVSAFVLDSRFGLDQGFHLYDDDLAQGTEQAAFMFRETDAADTTRRAKQFLAGHEGEQRWFLWVHYFDPHASYRPPGSFGERFAEQPYDGEIAYADAQLGDLLLYLQDRGELADTLVVLTADHGESLGEHGEATHGVFLYDATTRVPLIFRHPAVARGARVPGVVSAVDVAPTVLDFLGVGVPEPVSGVSLVESLLRGAADGEREPVYLESMSPYFQHGWSDLRSLRSDRRRYVRAPREELYDLREDPDELHNLLPGREGEAEPLREALEAMLRGGERDARRVAEEGLDASEREALEELGYVWVEGETVLPEGGTPLPDPKDKLADWLAVIDANKLLQAKRYAEAEEKLEELLSRNPASHQALSALARVYEKTERPAEARVLLLRMAAMPGRSSDTFLRIADMERRLGMASWRERLAVAREIDPLNPLPWVHEGDWLQEDGHSDEAMAAYQAALRIDDACSDAWIGMGMLHRAEGRRGEAEEALRRGLRHDPEAFEAWHALGMVMEGLRQPAEAEEHYRKALEIRPTFVPALVGLGNLYFRGEQLAQAEVQYRLALENRPGHFQANINLATLLLERGAFAEAETHFARAAEARPRNLDAHLGAARASQLGGRSAAAAEHLGRARAVDAAAVDARVARDPVLKEILRNP